MEQPLSFKFNSLSVPKRVCMVNSQTVDKVYFLVFLFLLARIETPASQSDFTKGWIIITRQTVAGLQGLPQPEDRIAEWQRAWDEMTDRLSPASGR